MRLCRFRARSGSQATGTESTDLGEVQILVRLPWKPQDSEVLTQRQDREFLGRRPEIVHAASGTPLADMNVQPEFYDAEHAGRPGGHLSRQHNQPRMWWRGRPDSLSALRHSFPELPIRSSARHGCMRLRRHLRSRASGLRRRRKRLSVARRPRPGRCIDERAVPGRSRLRHVPGLEWCRPGLPQQRSDGVPGYSDGDRCHAHVPEPMRRQRVRRRVRLHRAEHRALPHSTDRLPDVRPNAGRHHLLLLPVWLTSRISDDRPPGIARTGYTAR